MLGFQVGLKLGPEAQAKFDEAKNNPDKEGFLEKKGTPLLLLVRMNNNNMQGAKRKNWNKRYFILKDNYLFYCRNKNSPPQGIINLNGATIVKVEGPTINHPNCFSLLAPKSVSVDAKWTGRTYFFSTKESSEMEEWMKILAENSKKVAPKSPNAKLSTPELSKPHVDSDSETDNSKNAKKSPKKDPSSSESEEEVVQKKKPAKKQEDSSSESESEEEKKPSPKQDKKKQEEKKDSSSESESEEEPKKKQEEKKESSSESESEEEKKKKEEDSSSEDDD